MTTKAAKAEEKTEKAKHALEIRLSVLKKDLVLDDNGEVVSEAHAEHTAFHITDQALCEEIQELLSDAITKEHMDEVKKDADGEYILDAHKFELTGKKPEKKPAA